MARNKFNAKQVVYDGIKFHSGKEGNRYLYLKMLLQKGEIKNLELQKVFEILSGNDRFRPITYKADFVYEQDGETIVEDVKGYKKGSAYYNFTMKKKMLYARFGHVIQEV